MILLHDAKALGRGWGRCAWPTCRVALIHPTSISEHLRWSDLVQLPQKPRQELRLVMKEDLRGSHQEGEAQ